MAEAFELLQLRIYGLGKFIHGPLINEKANGKAKHLSVSLPDRRKMVIDGFQKDDNFLEHGFLLFRFSPPGCLPEGGWFRDRCLKPGCLWLWAYTPLKVDVKRNFNESVKKMMFLQNTLQHNKNIHYSTAAWRASVDASVSLPTDA